MPRTTRTKGRRKAAPKPMTKFRAADHPHRDYRGEKIVNGVKWRV